MLLEMITLAGKINHTTTSYLSFRPIGSYIITHIPTKKTPRSIPIGYFRSTVVVLGFLEEYYSRCHGYIFLLGRPLSRGCLLLCVALGPQFSHCWWKASKLSNHDIIATVLEGSAFIRALGLALWRGEAGREIKTCFVSLQLLDAVVK